MLQMDSVSQINMDDDDDDDDDDDVSVTRVVVENNR